MTPAMALGIADRVLVDWGLAGRRAGDAAHYTRHDRAGSAAAFQGNRRGAFLKGRALSFEIALVTDGRVFGFHQASADALKKRVCYGLIHIIRATLPLRW